VSQKDRRRVRSGNRLFHSRAVRFRQICLQRFVLDHVHLIGAMRDELGGASSGAAADRHRRDRGAGMRRGCRGQCFQRHLPQLAVTDFRKHQYRIGHGLFLLVFGSTFR